MIFRRRCRRRSPCALKLNSHRMLFRVRVSAVRGNQVQYPAEKPAAAKPQSRGEDQPQNPREHAPVVDLPEARKKQTKNTGNNWIAHRLNLPPPWNSYDGRAGFVRSAVAVTIYV